MDEKKSTSEELTRKSVCNVRKMANLTCIGCEYRNKNCPWQAERDIFYEQKGAKE
jgi:hypothetical protein